MFKPLLWVTWYFHGSKILPPRLVLKTVGLASVNGTCGFHCSHSNSIVGLHYSRAIAQQDAMPSEVMKRSMLASSLRVDLVLFRTSGQRAKKPQESEG